ncbi:sigma factor [Lapillicoccus sp.]|uniref:RNA polymerase sigma factor n=1 Tax=Lapillicoccus sp. TaxID=1909287 RepID=UPI003983D906
MQPEIEVMLRVTQSLTGNTPDAEDVTQESLIRAHRSVARFDGRHPRAWPLTIVRHTHLNMIRRQRPVTVGDWDAVRGSRQAWGRFARGATVREASRVAVTVGTVLSVANQGATLSRGDRPERPGCAWR